MGVWCRCVAFFWPVLPPLPLGAAVLSTPVSCMQLSALLFYARPPSYPSVSPAPRMLPSYPSVSPAHCTRTGELTAACYHRIPCARATNWAHLLNDSISPPSLSRQLPASHPHHYHDSCQHLTPITIMTAASISPPSLSRQLPAKHATLEALVARMHATHFGCLDANEQEQTHSTHRFCDNPLG